VKANSLGELEIFFSKPMQVVKNLTLFHLPADNPFGDDKSSEKGQKGGERRL